MSHLSLTGLLHPVGHSLSSRNKATNKQNKTTLTVGTWNVRTLLDLKNTDRPERRTALVTQELDRFGVDIASLSETRFSGEGSIEEKGSGYTIFWKGKKEGEPRLHGVGFAIKTNLVKTHNLSPTCINERLMSIRIPLSTTQFITIFSVYAPTLDADDNIKEEFYRLLDRELTNVPQNDKLLLLGDFNARVGKDHNVWRKVIGKEGLGSCNPNGHLLLGLCAEHHLVVTNTIFRQRNRYKTTWMHPRSKNWHILDYVITRQHGLQDILITRSMPSADDCWTDHRLVISKLRISLKTKTRYHSNNGGRRKFDITKLQDNATSSLFQETINRKIRENPTTANSLEEEWTTLRDIVTESAKETIGFQKKKTSRLVRLQQCRNLQTN